MLMIWLKIVIINILYETVPSRIFPDPAKFVNSALNNVAGSALGLLFGRHFAEISPRPMFTFNKLSS